MSRPLSTKKLSTDTVALIRGRKLHLCVRSATRVRFSVKIIMYNKIVTEYSSAASADTRSRTDIYTKGQRFDTFDTL